MKTYFELGKTLRITFAITTAATDKGYYGHFMHEDKLGMICAHDASLNSFELLK